MICLGIESTAHSFGLGIVDDNGNVLSNIWDMYRPPKGWGIKPIESAEHHVKIQDKLLDDVVKEAGIKLKDLDIISFSQGAGLPPCLHVGLNFAKEMRKKLKKPVIGVCHQIAHIEIGRLKCKQDSPVVLYTSGANTQILSFVEGRYRCFGETQDIGIGNALDKFGRDIGMEFPAGPKIEQEAKGGKYQGLPYTVKGMDLSFSGILTEAVRRVRNGEPKKDICFSLQETVFAMLTEVTERALAHTKKNEVLLTGGVAANKRLAEMLEIMCKERGSKFAVVPRDLSGDNGAMIGWTGILAYNSGMRTKEEILPRQRTDDVKVKWLE